MESDHQEQASIAKGKRTKRQRLPSPTREYGDTSSSNTTDQEEQDMANCLILLARGTPAAAATTPGCYGYECKTCFRTFPSFQALGGHRASHKKPTKLAGVEKIKVDDDDDHEEMQFKNNNNMRINNNSVCLNHKEKGSLYGKGKVHECGICGAEFTSGQALGGHMRRHRTVPIGTNTALSLTPMPMTMPMRMEQQHEDERQQKRQRSFVSLDLDLNLPAPQEQQQDHQTESKFFIKSNQQQPQQQQQQPLVFTTLVDCHY